MVRFPFIYRLRIHRIPVILSSAILSYEGKFPWVKIGFGTKVLNLLINGTWYYSLGVFLAIVDAFVRSEFEISSWRGARVDVRTYLLGGAIDGSEANEIIRDPKLELESSHFTFDLVPLSYESVDVVVGENWLLRHKAEMVCHEKVVKMPCVPKELVGFTPRRRIGFRMELVQGATPICEGSCRLTSLERQEVWNDCRSCKVRVGSNGNLWWEAFVLLGRKKGRVHGDDVAKTVFRMRNGHVEVYGYAFWVNQCTSGFHGVNEPGGVRVAREDDRGVTEGREDVREVFQQRGSGAKRKLSRCGRNQMGNEPILALPEGADDFVVYYDARSKDLEACLEKGRRLCLMDHLVGPKVVDGMDEASVSTPPQDPEWLKFYTIVLSWIFITCSKTLQDRLVDNDPQTAKEAWDLLESIFTDNKRSRAVTLKADLRALTLGSTNLRLPQVITPPRVKSTNLFQTLLVVIVEPSPTSTLTSDQMLALIQQQQSILARLGYTAPMGNTPTTVLPAPTVTSASSGSDATQLPSAFHAMTLQDPSPGNWNMDTDKTGSSSAKIARRSLPVTNLQHSSFLSHISTLWHSGLDHPGSNCHTSVYLSNNSISCNKEKSPVLCHACQLGKYVKLPFRVLRSFGRNGVEKFVLMVTRKVRAIKCIFKCNLGRPEASNRASASSGRSSGWIRPEGVDFRLDAFE
ncbi:hypothetical protein Tco_0435862 [Tanacetum coccineum]